MAEPYTKEEIEQFRSACSDGHIGIPPHMISPRILATYDALQARVEELEGAITAIKWVGSSHTQYGSTHWCRICESGALDVTGHERGCTMAAAIALAKTVAPDTPSGEEK